MLNSGATTRAATGGADMVWRFRPKPHSHASDAEGGAISAPAASITSLTVAALVAVGSVLSLAGGLAVTGALSAANVTTSSMTVSGAIAAGSVGIGTAPVAGYPARVGVGSGTAGGVLPVLIYSWTGSSVTHSAAGWMLAHSFTVPANTLVRDGDSLRVYAVAIATSTSQDKGVYCDFNGDDIERNNNSTSNRYFRQDSRVYRTSSTNLRGFAEKIRSGQAGSWTTVGDYDVFVAWDSTVSNEINCYVRSAGTGTPGDDADMDFIHMEVWHDGATQ